MVCVFCVCRFVNTRNINRESLFFHSYLSSSIDAAHITCLHAAATVRQELCHFSAARLLVVLVDEIRDFRTTPPGCLFLLEAIVGGFVAGQLGLPSAGLIPYH